MRWVVLTTVLFASACGDGLSAGVNDHGGVEIVTHDSDDHMTALGGYVLEYDADLNCLYHDEDDNNGEPGTGGRVIVVWPQGFTAERTDDGAVVRDADGTVVAETGVPFVIGGGGGAVEGHCDSIGQWLASGGPKPAPAE